MFRASDKLEILSNLRSQGVDITEKLLAPLVAQVEGYAKQKRLTPSDEPIPSAVNMFVSGGRKFTALTNSGGSVNVSEDTFRAEALYNFLPSRYKTLEL